MSYKFKEGDVVNARAIVTGGNGKRFFISVGDYSGMMVEPSILELISQPIQIDDVVLVLPDFATGIVRGVADEQAWVELENNVFTTEHFENLRLAQDLSEELEPANAS